MISERVQIGDIKPLGSVWPERAIKKVKREEKESTREQERGNGQAHDENDGKDDHAVDEYA